MGIFDNWYKSDLQKYRENKNQTKETKQSSLLSTPKQWLIDLFGGNVGRSNVKVNERSALQSSAVFACVDLISKTVASLNANIFRIEDDKRIRIYSAEAQKINKQPNQRYTGFQFRETMVKHILLYGNAYVIIERDGNKLKDLRLAIPHSIEIKEDQRTKKLYYYDSDYNELYDEDQIIHIRAHTIDGVYGLSPIHYAKEYIGSNIGAQRHQAQFIGNSAVPSGFLKLEGAIKDKDRLEALKSQFNSGFSGSNMGKTGILTNGAEYVPLGMSQKDSQFLELMQFGVEEIARIFSIPPALIGHNSGSQNFTALEALNLQFIQNCIRPLIEKIEAEFEVKLFGYDSPFEVEFDYNDLIKGNIESETQKYVSLFNIGVLSQNDIRKEMGLNPIDDGDTYNKPMNLSPNDDINNGKINREDGEE